MGKRREEGRERIRKREGEIERYRRGKYRGERGGGKRANKKERGRNREI